MTNHYCDIKNSDCILIMGSNAAEHHPIAFKWILRAKEKGARVIHVDPRYTRTSARCDYHVPYNDIAVLQSEINNAILASADLNGHVSVSVANNKIVFEADGEFSIQSGADIGINENEKSVSKVTTGDKSQLIAIFDQLIADLEADDTGGIGSALARIDNQFYNVNAIIAEIGVKMNRVELTSNRILDDTLNLRDLLSKNEDADIAEVVMNLKMQEYVYQASLSGGAKIIQPSLVDFLR